MSTVNMVRYYFYKGMLPKTEERTTSINGIRQKDPLGQHVTLCYKDENQLLQGTHVASHGYVKDEVSVEFVQATHHPEKPDSAKRQRGTKTVWPSEDQLVAAPEIGYGHLPSE
ncbi:hypothetical protein N7519_011382 [Penicillium mononematosum]|uniref:uncharacterized protein n=1 Tax=Penicillium mononematosum TaxID=268346 RepID=UPI0025479E64|nr:uncharacterized protein N7519_011382 [Penicillium mononematosum]KAJ6180921.1 hypothetical protein N7519_011382 [Penicillium mononematosum]